MRTLLLILSIMSVNVAVSEHAIAKASQADSLRQAEVMPGSYGSVLAAVIAASERYNPVSIAEDREYIGAILERDGRYFYAVGKGGQGSDSVSVRLRVPKGSKIIAFWHTHGAHGHGRSYFSAVDTNLANRSNKPFYLADPAGALKVYRPGDPTLAAIRAERRGLGRQSGVAHGRSITQLHAPRDNTASNSVLKQQARLSNPRHF